MIDADRIRDYTLSSPAEVEAFAEDITTIAMAFRTEGEEKPESYYTDFIEWLKENPYVLTIAYVDGKPAGWIRIDSHEENPEEVGRKCLEFSGAVLPEFEGTGLTAAVAPSAIEAAFAFHPKAKKVIAKIPDANLKAHAALLVIGFEPTVTDSDGVRFYRIMRNKDATGTS